MDAYRVSKLALDFVAPLISATQSPAAEAELLRRLGYAPPDGFTLLSGLAPAVEALADAAIAVADTPADAEESVWLSVLAEVTAALVEAIVAVQDVVTDLSPGTVQDPFVSGTDILEVLPERLANHLVATFLARRLAPVHAILVSTGILEVTVHGPSNQPYRVPFVEHTLRWDAIPDVVSDPLAALRTRYAWDDPAGIDADVVLRDLRALASGFGLRAELLAVDARAKVAFDLALGGDGTVPTAPDTLTLRAPLLPLPGSPLGIELYPVAGAAGVLDGLGIALFLDGALQTTVPLSDTLRAELTLGGYAGGLGVVFRRGRDPKVTTPVFGQGGPASVLSGVEIDIALALVLERPGGPPIVPLGTLASTHLEIGSVTTTISVGKPITGAVDLGAEIALSKGALVVRGGDGDGFISKVFGEGFTIGFDVTVGFSTSRGLYFAGAGSIEFTIPVHEDLFGVLIIDSIYVALRLEPEAISLVVAATATVRLGPVVGTVERIGLRIDYPLPQAGEALGAYGPVLGFKPPNGAGLVIDAGPVSGGGYLLIDADAGKYAGILQLSIADTLAITAIGLIATKMPDGRPGFSLLIIITIELPPIQLGYGFTLNGIGGLLGANRTMDVAALRTGVYSGGLNSVLFPRDPVANAPRIIRDLEAFFPIAQDRFVIGLMVAIGWGSSIIKVELGVIIEVPMPIRIALMGRLTVALPTEEAGVVLLHVAILGILDIEARELSIDAVLYDSRIAVFNISGDFAVRLNFGPSPAFAVSAGGFHPRFVPPPGFPELKRVQISLATSDNPRLRLDAYMATTPASVQTGAHIDIFAEVDLGILGKFTASAVLGFDALVYFVPRFSFVVDLGGSATISRNDQPIAHAAAALTISGPEPYRISGYAELDFFGKHRIAFDKTIGEEVPPPALEPGDPIGDLLAALGLTSSWRTHLPPDAGGLVSLRSPGESEAEDLLLHPFGAISVVQRVAPLEITIDRYAGAPVPPEATVLSVGVSLAGRAATGTHVREPFPAGQFFDLSDEAQITGEAFPRLISGLTEVRVPAADLVAPAAVDGAEGYETAVVNPASWRPALVIGTPYTFAAATLDVLVGTGAAGGAVAAGYAGPSLGLAVAEPSYLVASADDLTATDPTGYASHVEAAASSRGDGLQVVGAHEAVVA